MKFLRLFAFILLSAAGFPAFSQTDAKSPDSVAAVVNGDIITQRDLEQRTKLALLTSGLADTPEMRKNVQGPLLRRVIDEDLKIQMAIKEKLTVSADEVTAQMKSLDEMNHLPPGGLIKLLTSRGVEPEALRQQLRGDIAWNKLVHYVLARKVHISENAVQTRLDAIEANLGKPEYHVSEIFLGLDSMKDEAEVRNLAEKLTEQMHEGAPFAAIARQFNQAGAADGSLGWVSEGMLDDDLLQPLSRLQPNEVTAPIRTTEGYHILFLQEKRKVGEGLGGGPKLDLLIIDLNSIASAAQAERDLQMQHLREALAPAKSCDDLQSLARKVPSASVTLMEKTPESQLPAKVPALVKDLAPGQVSEPIDTPKGRRFFALCGRAAGAADTLPAAEDIRRQMEDEQLELVSRRYLIDLHRGAIIDIR
jgi:peptidyl-prolyl cis-trans isomerase SurA